MHVSGWIRSAAALSCVASVHCSRTAAQGTSGTGAVDGTAATATATATGAASAPPPEAPGVIGGADGCDLDRIGLQGARRVGYTPPDACRLKETPSPTTAIRSEEAFHAAYACTAPSGIDFAKNELRFAMRPLSPATVGVSVVDDGKTLTFVSRARQPCPKEPPPMPITIPVGYVVPPDGARQTADATCAISVPCR